MPCGIAVLLATLFAVGCDQQESTALRLTDRTQVAGAVGRRVTLFGPLLTCRNPTVLGVDVNADPGDCGKPVEVTGNLQAFVVERTPPDPAEESIGARGPGTYHQLVGPDGTLARVRVAIR